MKIAFTGSSGAGKTTLVKWVASNFDLQHISGSAGDLFTEKDLNYLKEKHSYEGGTGHMGVIRKSAESFYFGKDFQNLLRVRRKEIILNKDNFVTDRSPLDNLVYFINQVGFHKQCTDALVSQFAKECHSSWRELTHVIYVKAVQPKSVEDNGSRVSNWWYQQSIDAQFDKWLHEYFLVRSISIPKVLIIDYWNLFERNYALGRFLSN